MPLPVAKRNNKNVTFRQALLLLGGAFVLGSLGWTLSQERLVRDFTAKAHGDLDIVVQLVAENSKLATDPSWTRFVAAMPEEARTALTEAAASGKPGVVYSIRNPDGSRGWSVNEPPGPGRWRLVSKSTQAIGFVSLGGYRLPFQGHLEDGRVVLQVGRRYSGLLPDPPLMSAGRRLVNAPAQQDIYLEKPESARWNLSSWPLSEGFQADALKDFWNLPGRVEVTISASHTDAVFQPFALYFRPRGSAPVPRETIEGLVRRALAESVPAHVEVELPDGTKMQELHHDEKTVTTEIHARSVGDLVDFKVPGVDAGLEAFFPKTRDAWVSTDTEHIQQALLSNLSADRATDVCAKPGSDGYAALPGDVLPISKGFQRVTLSIHSLETGLFTICGYYP